MINTCRFLKYFIKLILHFAIKVVYVTYMSNLCEFMRKNVYILKLVFFVRKKNASRSNSIFGEILR